ncbi:hypothetical protein VW23_005345 [Devosia insulae DS-56]|uniref:DUF2155 domain-containing protein n=1 Tax=Devosia insulae DS-56 TaxID=1116389 RepID=A0A1E5XI77_9HYPH|nr:hypothetical protein [Devosia insulae]OEO28309.1 hypothetical protein VW23_005345 [Devosia insulae DS-56]
MLKRLVAIMSMAVIAGPALAIECPIPHAIYEQPGGDVRLSFTALPEDAAANQIAAFSIAIKDVSAKFDGAIYLPNGFGQPNGLVGHDCTGAEGEQCEFWDGVVYALGADGIEEYPHDAEIALAAQMAPRQVLLPQFAVNVWYSSMRQDAFADERDVLDTFTLAACAR